MSTSEERRYVNAAPHPLTLWDGRVVSAAAAFDAHPGSHYLRGLLSAGLVVAAKPEPAKPAARRGEETTP
jgi:hypothetical protein